MTNEVLLKLQCHNVVVVHSACIELGVNGAIRPQKADKARDLLPTVWRG
jgi:hypothetical protein